MQLTKWCQIVPYNIYATVTLLILCSGFYTNFTSVKLSLELITLDCTGVNLSHELL